MKATQAIISRHGGPEVIEWVTRELAPPGPGEVTLAHGAVGLNFIDIYHREGVYPLDLPSGLGIEAAGRVVAVGDGVTRFSEGDRAAIFVGPLGAYASARNVSAETLVHVPEDISDEIAAASLLKGCTSEFLVERCAKVRPGMAVLVHAGAGGVGQILVQWLVEVGARVFATVSTEEKARIAREAGADEVIIYAHEDVAERVRDLTGGAGVNVVFDGVGKDTYEASLASLARFGLLVSYGNASGPVTGIALGDLATHGSLFATRPSLFHYYADPLTREAGVARLWEMMRTGAIRLPEPQARPLAEAASAQADLAARRTTGSIVLRP